MDVPFTVIIVNSATKNNVTYYLLQVQQDDEEEMSYAVDRRFTDFLELAEQFRHVYGSYVMDKLPSLPKKTFIRHSTDSFVKRRHYHLQQFLNGIHEIPFLIQSQTYRNFLRLDSFFPSSIPIRPFLKFVQNKSQHGIRLSNFNMIKLSHNVFISIAGCHPEIAFCSAEKILTIQHRINQANPPRPTKHKTKSNANNTHNVNAYHTSKEDHHSAPLIGMNMNINNGHHTANPLLQQPNSPLSGRISCDLTNIPSSSMLPAPNEWGGCIQIWYYDTTAMNTSAAASGNFSWWLEERRDDNKNFYGWNSSTQSAPTKKALHEDSEPKQTMDDYYSYYGGVDDLPSAQHDLHLQSNTEKLLKLNKNSTHKLKRMKQVNRELDCIFLSEVPTSLYYDVEHQQLFVGTLMGNLHRFKIIHNQKIEATGILPNPNIYNNVSNIHNYCHSSIYTYIHHESFHKNKKEMTHNIHQRLYEQRELLKLKERQLHHKKARRKMVLIPDNDAIYNKAILNMVSYDGVLYISDACSNIHAFSISEFKHLHYLSLDHYFVDILQTEYKVHVDQYYKKRLSQYRAQHERMMFKSDPKDIHAPVVPYDADPYGDDNGHMYMEEDGGDDGGGGGLFSKAFLKNRSKNKGALEEELETQNELKSYGLRQEHENTLSVPMRIGVEADTAYEMYFDELVFSTTITKQKEKILNVTNKLNQDIIVTDLIKFEDSLFIPTNLPYLTLAHLRYSKQFNVTRPNISVSAVLEASVANIQQNDITVDEKDKEDEIINPYKGQKYKYHSNEPPAKRAKQAMGCENIFGTVSNFDSHNDVLYSIPTIHTIHKEFLIYDVDRIRAAAQQQSQHHNTSDNTHDMSVFKQCMIFVWAFTTHISVDMNEAEEEDLGGDETQFADYDSWYDNKRKKAEKKRKKKKVNVATKDRTWYLKCKWFDKTVDFMCKEFSALTYCQSIGTLAVAGISGYVALFNAVGVCFNIFFAHTDCITKMIWLDGHKQLVSTGLDGTIKIWNLYHSQYAMGVNPNPNEVLDDVSPPIKPVAHREKQPTPPQQPLQSAPANAKKAAVLAKDIQYKESEQKEVIEDDFDALPELKIEDDEDLASLWKSKTDNIEVDEYNPFGDKAFDDYLDKRGQSFKQQSEQQSIKQRGQSFKPVKPQRRPVSSKELFAAQTVLKDKQPPVPAAKAKSAKSGFRTMKLKTAQKLKTSTAAAPITNDMAITNNAAIDEMAEIESYILQQNEENNSPNVSDDALTANAKVLVSDHSPKPGVVGLDLMENDSSPEPQRNASFHVVKKTKPKRRKKRKKDKEDRKKKKKKDKKKKKKQNAMEMEPEDCTIRYSVEAPTTYTGILSKKLSKIKHKIQENKAENSTNPFDAIGGDNNNESSTNINANTNPFGFGAGASKQAARNPFGGHSEELADTNPFSDNVTQIKKTKSTNPFAADLP